ncbi:Molybdate-binding periplasmic protein precursor [Nocardioides dokdonensis FR1436]|uniref:Molybdate-binding periplasmic protein n=1 Tax=Nocardioides dokdonensis FR1436 TaxID=1300347 RepID=A0A1A9GLY1_9ACTN|nr:molybdate ABC transporter substrate-binding protein [Nocardioides dokdonensis]ANH38491.1 Molybdate-binding periplasmic protein precursor [Nocardioides dokdonensis FR1436]
MNARPHVAAGLLGVLALLPLAACSSSSDPAGGAGEPSSSGTSGSESLTVLAAASLTETFTELAAQFEAEHPGVEVTLAFDSSATLAQQALEGAPADVLATADTRTMESAAAALAGAPELFATNTLVLVVPAGNPAGIEGLDDLSAEGVDYVACVETAPCGAVWAALAEQAGVETDAASLEVDVKAVLARVVADEADAGLVYATDAVAAGDAVETITVPGAEQQPTSYPLSILQQTQQPDLAQDFVDLVLGEVGSRVLADAGFGAP